MESGSRSSHRAETGEAHFQFVCERHGLANKPRERRARSLKDEVRRFGEEPAQRYPDEECEAIVREGGIPEGRHELFVPPREMQNLSRAVRSPDVATAAELLTTGEVPKEGFFLLRAVSDVGG